jgi:hypothetical protein
MSQLMQQKGISADPIILDKPLETADTGDPQEARRVYVEIDP